jgi:hypothetical protein
VFRATPNVDLTRLSALLAGTFSLLSCAPPAEEPDAGLPDGPEVAWVEPEDGATGVAINPIIRVGVTDHLDDSTVDSGAFRLYSGPISMWLMAYYDPVGRRATVWPSGKLREGTYWVFEAREGITGRDGGPLAAGRITGFSTGYETGDDAPFPALEYEGDIAPIFSARCASCHGGDGPVGGLALDSSDGIVETAIGAPSTGSGDLKRIVPGRPGRSFLVYKIIDDEAVSGVRMPRSFDDAPAAPLSTAEQQAISDWIAGGAVLGQ